VSSPYTIHAQAVSLPSSTTPSSSPPSSSSSSAPLDIDLQRRLHGPDAAYFKRVADIRNARTEIHARVELQRAQVRGLDQRCGREAATWNNSKTFSNYSF
jgi:hypothetical protein